MLRSLVLIMVSLVVLAACGGGTSNNGRPGDGTTVFKIGAGDTSKIQFRMLDSVNAVRVAQGLTAVQLSPELIAAAKTHSFDMSKQNRPWHFGSDGSSPIDRVQRAGYAGTMLGENISETYEGDLQTVTAWMADATTRDVIMDARARFMGVSWHQQSNGKIWWTMLMGT